MSSDKYKGCKNSDYKQDYKTQLKHQKTSNIWSKSCFRIMIINIRLWQIQILNCKIKVYYSSFLQESQFPFDKRRNTWEAFVSLTELKMKVHIPKY